MARLSDSNTVDVVNRITCIIKTSFRTGTGVLLRTKQSNLYYLLTAKHCLLRNDDADIVGAMDVAIYIPDPTSEDFYQLKLDESASILLPLDNTDGALIAFKKKLSFEVPSLELSEIRYTIEECFFRGYPQAYSSTKGITIDQVRYTDNNVVTTSRNLSTIDSDPLYNCQGFSGSGIFCKLRGRVLLIGLLYKLEEPFQLFSVTDLSFLQGLPSLHDLPELQFLSFPQDQIVIEDIEKLKQKTHLVLDGINNRLGNSLFVERNNIDDDFDTKLTKNQMIVIKGEAGVGKSAYAKEIVHRLADSNYFIFAVKADSLARDSIKSIFPEINSDLYSIFYQLGLEKQVVILIDSFEKLLEVDNFEALKELLRHCKSLPNVKVIITCRTFAYQQLLFELYDDLPKFDFVDVSPFNDTELIKIETTFPFLAEILEVEKYKQILRRPFYLNLVIRNWELFKDKQFLTEKEVRRIIWDNVIVKNDIQRARIFEAIALNRAKSMSLYTRINDPTPEIITQLHSDGIIDIEDNLGEAFSPAHDIFEDIALIRFVERVFQNTQYPIEFFYNLGGKEPAIRRAFRLWVNDQLLLLSNQFILFLTQILTSSESEIDTYYKDELLIAVLRSEYCANFILTNAELLKENKFKLFLRLVHLLRTTCQEPDEQLAQTIKNHPQSSYWIYLRPVGPGWEAITHYIDNNLNELKDYYRLIFVLITYDWSKKITLGTNLYLPAEAKSVGNILFTILEEIKSSFSSRRDSTYSKKDIDSALQVLFRLVSLFDVEIRKLIEDANSYPKRGSENSHIANHNLRDFYDSVIAHTLSGLYSKEVCKKLPDLVTKIAINNWLRVEQEEKIHGPFGYRLEHPLGIGRDFGLTEDSEFHYFPAGIYKTPIRFLLYFHPDKALNLIVKVINHATDSYAKSERGKSSNIINVDLHNYDGGSIFQQKGNMVLWGMYRGMVETTPYLLQSILMSLESWLLELCMEKSDWTDKLIEYTYHHLLMSSKSVATTSVLASVAMAYPKRIGKLCFPILKVREFYSWDTKRFIGDRSPLAPLDNDIPFAQEERHKSNQLHHREFRLENLVTKLQVEGYWDEINLILDKFTNEVDQDDKLWKLALNRMDIRKYEIYATEEVPEKNQLILKPKIDQELVEMVNHATDKTALANKATTIATWSRSVYEDKKGIEKTFAKWQNEYQSLHELATLDAEFVKPFETPNYLAAIGIKNFHSLLNDEELNWCIDTITSILSDAIQAKLQEYPPSVIFLEPAVQTAPFILSLEISEEKRKEIKEIIFLSLLFLNGHKMEYPYESIRSNLWSLDNAFANSCLKGMIEYSKIHKARKYFHPQSEEEKKYWLKHLREIERLSDRVCKNESEVKIDRLSFKTHSHWYLGYAALIVPQDTTNDTYIQYINTVSMLLLEIQDKGREKNIDLSQFIYTEQNFREYLAQFLLKQSKTTSQELFSNILDYLYRDEKSYYRYESTKYVKELLERIIIEEDKINSQTFWDLWEILENKIRTTGNRDLISCLFLSIPWWSSDAEDWQPLKQKKFYVRKLIVEFGHKDIHSVVKLLSGIGTTVLLPDGIIWFMSVLNNTSDILVELGKSNVLLYSERLIQKVYYRYLNEIKTHQELRESFLHFLDILINQGSSLAFIIRERVISV
jgi:hypothetical protein